MRKYGVIVGCICVLALLVAVALTGCGRRAVEEPPAEPQPVEGVDEMPADTAEEPAVGDAETLADVMANWPESFVMTVTTENKETGETTTATAAMRMADNKPVKIKAEIPEGGFLADYEDKAIYTWEAGGDVAMKMDTQETEENMEDPYTAMDPDAKIVGSETIDGVECWVVETTDADGNTVTSWLAKDNGLVQKTESDRSIETFEYDQVGSVPDSEFEVPAGMEIQEMPDMGDMPEMPEDMPEAPEGAPGG